MTINSGLGCACNGKNKMGLGAINSPNAIWILALVGAFVFLSQKK